MLPPVFVTLKASSAVRAIVGTSPARIYRHGNAPQDVAKPYITWTAFGAPENQLSGTPTTDKYTVQVDCWHQTDKGVEDMADAVRDAIEPVAHMTAIRDEPREPETKLYRVSLDFDWFNDRPS